MASKNILGGDQWSLLTFFENTRNVVQRYERGEIKRDELLGNLWYNCACISQSTEDATDWYHKCASLVPCHPPVYNYKPSVMVAGYIGDGKKVQAIKEIRAETGLGLKEAKNIADELEKSL